MHPLLSVCSMVRPRVLCCAWGGSVPATLLWEDEDPRGRVRSKIPRSTYFCGSQVTTAGVSGWQYDALASPLTFLPFPRHKTPRQRRSFFNIVWVLPISIMNGIVVRTIFDFGFD